MIELANETLSLQVRLQGAAILKLTDRRSGSEILRPTPAAATASGDCALFPMLPLANRVSGNAFHWQGRVCQLPASPVDERFFLHGDGWLLPWRQLEKTANYVTLVLESRVEALYHYRALLTYGLWDNVFSATLQVTHLAEIPFPYGLGFHPFFARQPDTRIQFDCEGYWPECQHHLPGRWQSSLPAELDFQIAQTPQGWINNAFSGWSGQAQLSTPSTGQRITLLSQTPYLMVYQPASQADFICLEPQTHPVDAHNHPQLPGLRVLGAGESVTLAMRILCH
ncbi:MULTISPECIES: aldose 1-epimerase [unclassified Serratia (in: enterobacteria)]|uniref:aldose 1-epimerase n=1 Tax=unclassified Serratia (in: enterobacteria) TaxID=2647522 RepID=UPI0004A7E744|nr:MULTISPECIES: aldose 1-epimerase [unclassified Serratia (in: enterobacteria)]